MRPNDSIFQGKEILQEKGSPNSSQIQDEICSI